MALLCQVSGAENLWRWRVAGRSREQIGKLDSGGDCTNKMGLGKRTQSLSDWTRDWIDGKTGRSPFYPVCHPQNDSACCNELCVEMRESKEPDSGGQVVRVRRLLW